MPLEDNLLELTGGNIIEPDNTVIPPSGLPQNTEPLTVIPEGPKYTGPDAELSPEFKKELPTMDITFKLIEGNTEKLVTMAEVEETILGDNLIDKQGADTIEQSMEGLFTGAITRSHFTDSPSGVNFSHVKRHVVKQIALEEAALIGNFQALLTLPIENAKKVLRELVDNYYPYMVSEAVINRSMAVTLADKIAGSKNLVAQTPDGFSNVSKVDLSSCIEGGYKLNGSPKFDELCKGLHELFEDVRLKALVLSCGEECVLDDSNSHDQILVYAASPITIQDLINFYNGGRAIQHAEGYVKKAEEMIVKMEEIQKEAEPYREKAESIRDFLSKNYEEIVEATQYHTNIVKYSFNMIHLNFLAKEFFELFAKQG